MFGLSKWALAFTAALGVVQQTVARPTELHPGNAHDIIINAKDTINSTQGGIVNTPNAGNSSGAALKISITNNFGNNVNCYVIGQDPNKNKAPAILQPDGTFFYPSAPSGSTPQPITENIALPLNAKGQTTEITIPGYLISARVWFAVGHLQFFTSNNPDGTYGVTQPSETNPSDPSAGVNWGFIEFNYDKTSGVFANISYVDFVGLPLGMSLTNTTGGVQTALGLPADAVPKICNDLKKQAAVDGKPWDQLCQSYNGTVLRILSPYSYMSANSSSGFEDYFDDYVKQVWQKYSRSPLIINTQGAEGNVSCTVSGGVLGCPGDNKNYTAPTSGDIFSCATGVLTAQQGVDTDVHVRTVPRLCAAFHRGTLLLDGGNVQPSLGASSYYTDKVSNFYSKIVHKYEIDGKGYAFSYDDINPSGDENASGTVSSGAPSLLSVTVGGPST